MPRPNRVTPFGEIVACPERGTFMGNRGILHDNQGNLTVKRWTHSHWVTCVLEFKGRRHPIMAPGHYTELFFLDEATALAAGHRPCGECRRSDYNRFKALWLEANPSLIDEPSPRIGVVDRILHRERVNSYSRRQVTFQAALADLPNGTFVTLDDSRTACLVWDDDLRVWSPQGYLHRIRRPPGAKVTVLTPRSIVNTLAAGYVPQVLAGNNLTRPRP
jgi:hypothetical protein